MLSRMTLERQLVRWVEAGLLTTEQARQIREFERTDATAASMLPPPMVPGPQPPAHAPAEHRPTLLYAIAGLGALAIAVGLVSIVASNWDAIPSRVKIGIDLGLVAALGVGVWHWERRGAGWVREAAIVVLYALVLASIALIGQVYQLGGQTHEALLAWSVLTALLMSRARSGFGAMVWILGLQTTWLAWAIWLGDQQHAEQFALSTVYWAPLLCLAIGRLPPLRRVRPALAATLTAVGWFELLLCATLGTFAFYEDTAREGWSNAYPGAMISAVATVSIAIALLSSLPQRLLLVACLVLAHVPLFTSPGDLDVVAAATFVVLWLLVAWAAHHDGELGVLNLATAMVGLRIVAIYFEVFGTLLDTGLGLVSGGLLTLGLVWLWARKRRQFERELVRPDHHPDHPQEPTR
jgi:uncharacterized membrane protein